MQVGCFGVETTLAAYMLITMCRKVNERDLFALPRAGSSGMEWIDLNRAKMPFWKLG